MPFLDLNKFYSTWHAHLLASSKRCNITLIDAILNRLEPSSVRLQCRACRKRNDQVHFSDEINMISRFGDWRLNGEPSGFPNNRHIHEAVESARNAVLLDTVLCERVSQVTETSWSRVLVLVDDAEHLLGARREEKIVGARRVFHDTEHDVAAVAVEPVASGEVDLVRVVEAAAVGDDFALVMGVEGNEVGDLDALGVDDCQALAFLS